jgi:hypothetical protein
MKLKVIKTITEVIDIPLEFIQPFIEVRDDEPSDEECENLEEYLNETHGEIVDSNVSTVFNDDNIYYEA